MKTKHTQGQWYLRCDQDDEAYTVFSDVGGRTALATTPEFWPASFGEVEANFKLIAAAPELLEALKECIEKLQDIRAAENSGMVSTPLYLTRAIAKGKLAIKKATS